MKISRDTLRLLARECRDIQALVALNDHALVRNHGGYAEAISRSGNIEIRRIR